MEDETEEVGITGEELEKVVAEQQCAPGVMTSVRKLVGSFATARQFLAATDAELARRGRYGTRTQELIAKIRERCYILSKNREERYRYNRSFARYLDERDRRMALEVERLNPVFTASDLQAAALYMGEEKVEYIDLRRLNEFRHAMTAAQREELKRRYEAQEAERARREAEEAAARAKERAEREAAPARERRETAAEGRDGKGGRNGRK